MRPATARTPAQGTQVTFQHFKCCLTFLAILTGLHFPLLWSVLNPRSAAFPYLHFCIPLFKKKPKPHGHTSQTPKQNNPSMKVTPPPPSLPLQKCTLSLEGRPAPGTGSPWHGQCCPGRGWPRSSRPEQLLGTAEAARQAPVFPLYCCFPASRDLLLLPQTARLFQLDPACSRLAFHRDTIPPWHGQEKPPPGAAQGRGKAAPREVTGWHPT